MEKKDEVFNKGNKQKSVLKRISQFIIGIAPFFTFLSLGVAILFGVLSAYQYQEITDQMSTRYINAFPGQMNEIIEKIIVEAEDELFIACDVPAYGCFSDPINYNRYKSAINGKFIKEDFKLCLIYHNLARNPKYFCHQLGINAEWLDIPEKLDTFYNIKSTRGILFRKMVENFCNSYEFISFNEIKTIRDITNAIDKIHKEFLESLKSSKNVKINVVAVADLSAYCWVKDNEEAIFSFHTYSTEESFFTIDERVIKILTDASRETLSDIMK